MGTVYNRGRMTTNLKFFGPFNCLVIRVSKRWLLLFLGSLQPLVAYEVDERQLSEVNDDDYHGEADGAYTYVSRRAQQTSGTAEQTLQKSRGSSLITQYLFLSTKTISLKRGKIRFPTLSAYI